MCVCVVGEGRQQDALMKLLCWYTVGVPERESCVDRLVQLCVTTLSVFASLSLSSIKAQH